MAARTLTAARLRELLHYDPLTGVFTRLVDSGKHGRWKAGTVAGSKNKPSGYVILSVDGVRDYAAHQLAWLYVHGEWALSQIDHIDTVSDHNWISNLRKTTQSGNQQNRRKARSDSGSGLLGVHRHTQNKLWQARIQVDGEITYLGLYRTPEAAYAAYLQAKARLHPYQTLVEQHQ